MEVLADKVHKRTRTAQFPTLLHFSHNHMHLHYITHLARTLIIL